ncbi:aspartyl/asparaginyl beta-hydroxylase domain-containing protein [Massilia sp. CF038]|uniref:aspartyl/asparaginyl beta-hydroxylase domain-containing protein n=1 Tax=Massilia sp. CF038 TaxID=1881045 RepID=UPI00091752EF|nr:aspartyl/asparaginyl beta-hydroxylase domain-containing protein [Massilia sp. CF038]SHH21696.1 Aspartyl/asparaginyl beta-hydroxylase, cupin superfamily [Massilia sp. CF038]
MKSGPILTVPPTVAEVISKARALMAESQAISAEAILRPLVAKYPDCVEAWMLLADLAEQRGDDDRARACLASAQAQAPRSEALAINIAQAQLEAGKLGDAVETLARLLAELPLSVLGWVMLGDVLQLGGLPALAATARYEGITRGQSLGLMVNMETTPEPLRPVIEQLIASINEEKFARLGQAFARMREQLGASAITRVEHAIAAYLGQVNDGPASVHQRPKFLFFPGLPEGPYHDPYLHPWARQLDQGYDAIRAEALAVLGQNEGVENFLSFQPGQSKAGYLGGDGSNPSWDAFFFYRHGQRNDANHLRCPATSSVLKSIELCEVEGQAPEICYSILQPGTHIMPHHGVTNTRLVMHLPLLVPADCALHVHGADPHVWKERELVMFDDTFKHEAWNKSQHTRVVLLMDCWNPHLTAAERVATRHLTETIATYENFPLEDLGKIAQQLRGATPVPA